MLTADLVRTRRAKGELQIVEIDAKSRPRLLELCGEVIAAASSSVGRTRDELEAALAAIDVTPRDARVLEGLAKLIEDRCEIDADVEASPEDLRREVFLRAAEVRAAAGEGATFDRAAVLEEVAERRAMDPVALEAALYADLRGAQVVRALPTLTPEQLLTEYEEGQPKAVLLRAVRVVVVVRCASAGAFRALFRKVKFLRLLFSVREVEGGAYRLEIEGPFSMFDAVTKYGLKLAMLLPALDECTSYELEADVRWGKAREAMTFRRKGGVGAASASTAAAGQGGGDGPGALPDDVAALVKGFKALPTLWRVAPSTALLALEGVGLCVPDLEFEHRGTGEKIFLEVMGFWSREAVWRRVDLVERGLSKKIVFAVSERLRVSEAVLGADAPAALYVYKGVMSPKVLAERLEALRLRAKP